MLILPRQKKIFIHVPKTGGTAIEYSIMQAEPTAIQITGQRHHERIKIVEECYPKYEKFVVLRNPVEIYYSHYNFILDILKNGNHPHLHTYAKSLPVDSFLNHTEYLCENSSLCNFGGFSSTYTNDNTKIFYYGDNIISLISKYLDLPLENYKFNVSSYMDIGVTEWTKSKNIIHHFCWKDYEDKYLL